MRTSLYGVSVVVCRFQLRLQSPHACKGIQYSLGFWTPRHGFRIPGTGLRILCQWNLDSGFREMYSGFQRPRFWIPRAKNFLESGFQRKNSLDSGIRIPLNAAIAVNKVTLSNRSQSKGRGKKRKFKSWLARHSTDMTLN